MSYTYCICSIHIVRISFHLTNIIYTQFSHTWDVAAQRVCRGNQEASLLPLVYDHQLTLQAGGVLLASLSIALTLPWKNSVNCHFA